MTEELPQPIETGQVYRDEFDQSKVEIQSIFVSEDGETEIRVEITKPDGEQSRRTLDAMSVFKRIRNDDLTLVEEAEA